MKSKLATYIMVATLFLSMFLATTPNIYAQQTLVRVIPSPIELGTDHSDVRGTEFKVAVVVENVENLYGLSVKVYINTTYFQYVSHTTTIPVDNYPAPQPPSPYGGILNAPAMKTKDEYDPLSSILTIAYSSQSPAQPFSGSGTVCIITLRLIYQPFDFEIAPAEFVSVNIVLTEVKLAGYGVPPPPIPFTKQDGVVNVYYRVFEYPPLPMLKIMPESKSGSALGELFTFDVWLLGQGETDLSSFWDIAGIDLYLNFDPSLIQAVNIQIDPDGWFASFWPHGIFEIRKVINNTAGWVRIAFMGVGGVEHSPPFGQGRIASITFNVTYVHLGYPPPSCTIFLKNPEPRPSVDPWGPMYFPVNLAGFPHPERPMSPWNGAPYSVPIPHVVKSAKYTAPFRVLGAQIDVFTQYPFPYGGQYPNNPSDMFTPQSLVVLYAKVTYNNWPEQQKDVAFEIKDPYGKVYTILHGRTNQSGIAMVSFRLPWMCDDPEYYLGKWTVVATTEVAGKVINDTLWFKYDYLVRVWKTTLDKVEYDHYEEMTVTIEYGSFLMQTRNVTISVTAKDETGVPFDWDYKVVTIGGAEWCTYANGTVTITLYIPKWARSGQGTVEVTVLTDFPQKGGFAVYPTRSPETLVNFGIKIPA
ncbi:MAG: cohesin domain-containing protein [Candidatus Bathyarchaeia archaeon]